MRRWKSRGVAAVAGGVALAIGIGAVAVSALPSRQVILAGIDDDGILIPAAVADQADRVQPPVQVTPKPPNPCAPPQTPAGAKQVVVVTANGTFATVDLYTLVDGEWQCTRTGMSGRVGRTGIKPLAQRVSGDGSTPSGSFPLGEMTAPDGQVFQFFGNGANPGVQGGWRQVQANDCWDASGGDASYNTLTARSEAQCPGPDDEYLPRYQTTYSQAALIGANMGPDRSGDQAGETPRAAAIFLHRHTYSAAGASKPTSGCVSLAASDLAAVLSALVPGEAWFVIR